MTNPVAFGAPSPEREERFKKLFNIQPGSASFPNVAHRSALQELPNSVGKPRNNNKSKQASLSQPTCASAIGKIPHSVKEEPFHSLLQSVPFAPSAPPATPESSVLTLDDLYRKFPEKRLDTSDSDLLQLASNAIRLMMEEATVHFLSTRVAPELLQGAICRIVKGEPCTSTILPVSPDTINLEGGRRSLAHLMNNCRETLGSTKAEVKSMRDVSKVADQGISLCDALGDDQRKNALFEAKNGLEWFLTELDCKTLDMYRRANQMLRELKRAPVLNRKKARRKARMELDILQTVQNDFEKQKAPTAVKLHKTLLQLMEDTA